MITSLFPIVATRDIGASLHFYRELLGGQVVYEYPGEDGNPVYVSVRIGASDLGIGLETALVDVPRPRAIALWVYTDDCDAVVGRLRNAGVPVITEPETQPWGERVARVLDPDGNEVIIGARIHESRPA